MKVLFTVDVEGHKGKNPIDNLIWGKTTKGNFGIAMMMDIFDENDIIGIFFVDIAEAWEYGKEKISEVVKYIKHRGHEVGVHIHPDHMGDKRRPFLWQYSYEEQLEIIKKCTQFYIDIVGEQPSCFRAGKYGANQDTLDIIRSLGYKYDFSEFYGNKWCGIKNSKSCTAIRRLQNGIVEIPISSYASFHFRNYSRMDKVDTAMAYNEFKYIFNKAYEKQYFDPLIMFSHSFFFVKWRRNPNIPRPNYRAIRKFKKMIKRLKERNCEFEQIENLELMLKEESIMEPLQIIGPMAYVFFLERAIKYVWMSFETYIQMK